MNQKIALVLFLLIIALPPAISACNSNDDYYVYGYWKPAGDKLYSGPGGYIDETNALGRGEGKEYLVFASDGKGQLYEVVTNGDPALHPCDPENTGPVAPRNFIHVSTGPVLPITSHNYGFYIDETGIYYGMINTGILHWDFDWNPINDTLPSPLPIYTQSFARNPDTGDFWAGESNRRIYRCKKGETNWSFAFEYPDLGGNHHDGLAYANGSLFISDMTSDHIIQYRLDDEGNPIDPGNMPFNQFDYSASPHVEMMEFGPNLHIWVGGWGDHSIYEIGGGELQKFLNKAPEVEIDTDADEGPVPLPVEFDATGSSDEDGFITLWEWDFDGDGKIDLAGHNGIGQEAKNIGGIPYSDPAAGFSCSSGQDLNIGGVIYCKYNSYQDAITGWFNNVEGFKTEGINTVESLLSDKFDPYIWGGSTDQKIDALRGLIGMLRHKCTKGQYYTPPAACSQYCKIIETRDLIV